MKMRRIVTAESKSGVVVQASDLLEPTTADIATNIWGFDQLPNLPLAAEQVLGEYRQKGIFGPKGAVRVVSNRCPRRRATRRRILDRLLPSSTSGRATT